MRPFSLRIRNRTLLPAGRALIAAAGLALVVALAFALTLALPGSGTVQARDEEEPGAQAAGVTPASTVTFTVSNVYDVKATLNLSGHATAWYYKANKAPDNTCKTVTANTATKELTGLTANTSYTYTAYSNSGCSTKVGDSVTFITKKQILTLVENGRYTAALSLRGLNLTKAHVKGDGTAPYNTCAKWSGAVDDDGLLQLTGLTAGTDYTYRVYEDSGCATELAKIEFTTYGAGLTLSKLGDTTATLKISEHTGVWYYKERNAVTCQGPVAAGVTTKDLTGLTHDTFYVYRAYSDSACATQVARLSFYTKVTGATPELTVSYLSPTMAQLNISGNGDNPWLFSTDAFESGRCIGGVKARVMI